ncbi:hypothetical protein TNCV_4525501 [Trichonephila clavipes]|nr:hypothetical protein TNCV_4525501 [Trichonephila clavipes]
MFRSAGQSDVKPPVLNPQGSMRVAALAKWLRSRTHSRRTMSYSLVLLKTHRTEGADARLICRDSKSSGWRGVGVLAQEYKAPIVDLGWSVRFEPHTNLSVCNHASSCYDEAHYWLNGYVNKQNCRIWSEANPQVYVETPLHPEKLTVWCALWAGGILLQKR